MKKIALAIFTIISISSCTVKEEYTISEQGKVDYNYVFDGSNAKIYLPNDFFKQEFDFLSEEELNKLSKGMTIAQFYDFMKNKEENKAELSKIEKYFKENSRVFQQIKNYRIFFNFYDIRFETATTTEFSKLDNRALELNNFVNGLTKLTKDGVGLEFISNKKRIDQKKLTVELNKKSFEHFSTAFNDFYSNSNPDPISFKIENFLSYQIKITAPKPITSTNLEGNIFSFDRKSVTGNFSFNEIFENKISDIEVVYE